jgi:hypothetical protein
MSWLCANVLLVEMHKPNMRCNELVEETAGALNNDAVTLMLLAVQKSNLELSVNLAVKRWVCWHKALREYLSSQCSVHPYFTVTDMDMKRIVGRSLVSFPYVWVSVEIISTLVPAPDRAHTPLSSW